MMKKSFTLSIMLLCVAPVFAQGTIEDYRRAYGLYDKFNNDCVTGWPRDIKWEKDSHVFSYSVMTDEGRRWVRFDADSASMTRGYEGTGVKDIPTHPLSRHSFGRHHEPHWMEVDEEKETRLVPSPDGQWEAWIEGQNVVVHRTGTPYSEKQVLSQDGTLANYYSNRILWSPDSRRLMTCKLRSVEKRYVYYVESSPHDQLQPILHKQEYAKPGDELIQRLPVVFDVETGRRTVADTSLCSRQYDLGWFEWTEDSRNVIMEYNERGHKIYRVLSLDAETGSMRTVVEERAATFVNYNRMYRNYNGEHTQMVWMSERDNWTHLYLVDVGKGKIIKQITRGEWCVRRVLNVDWEAHTILFSASGVEKDEDPYFIKYYRTDFDGKNLVFLTPDKGTHQAVFSSDFTMLVDMRSTVTEAPETTLRSATDGSLLETIATADISRLKQNGWQAPEVFVAKGRDGVTDIWGIIQRPTNFDPQKKYPIIEYIYAGPGDAYTPKSFNPYNRNMMPLAELGFIVVQLDGMGTSWRGKRFEEICYKNLQDAGFPDRIAWIHAAAERYPYMDIDRVGIFGASAGGQESTTAVLLHGDFYKAAYSSCGCHDNRMDKIWWNEQWMGYPVDSAYVRSSNVFHADKLERPLMLVVGELDDNVDPASTYQLADALIRANKDFELVVLPGVHHTMGESYGEHKRFDFFTRHLLGVEPPKWNLLAP